MDRRRFLLASLGALTAVEATPQCGLPSTSHPALPAHGLLVRELGIGLHPMSQALEEDPVRSDVASRLGTSGVPQFLLRVGDVHGDYGDPVSVRRAVESFATRA